MTSRCDSTSALPIQFALDCMTVDRSSTVWVPLPLPPPQHSSALCEPPPPPPPTTREGGQLDSFCHHNSARPKIRQGKSWETRRSICWQKRCPAKTRVLHVALSMRRDWFLGATSWQMGSTILNSSKSFSAAGQTDSDSLLLNITLKWAAQGISGPHSGAQEG